jgi:hypothetical protein
MFFKRYIFHKDFVSFAAWPTVSGRTPAYRWSNHRATVDSQSRDRLILKNEKYVLPYQIHGFVTWKKIRISQPTSFGRRNIGQVSVPEFWFDSTNCHYVNVTYSFICQPGVKKLAHVGPLFQQGESCPVPRKKRNNKKTVTPLVTSNLTHSIEATLFLIWNYCYQIRRFWAQNPSPKCFIN